MAAVAAQQTRIDPGPYPVHLLDGLETGLTLFAAAFLGSNDAIHLANRGIRTTCVDTDRGKLIEMRALYPAEWEFIEHDAFDFAADADQQWDVVSVDPFLGDGGAARVREELAMFMRLARHLITVTIVAHTEAPNIDGWQSSIFTRSHRASWLVMQRD